MYAGLYRLKKIPHILSFNIKTVHSTTKEIQTKKFTNKKVVLFLFLKNLPKHSNQDSIGKFYHLVRRDSI